MFQGILAVQGSLVSCSARITKGLFGRTGMQFEELSVQPGSQSPELC